MEYNKKNKITELRINNSINYININRIDDHLHSKPQLEQMQQQKMITIGQRPQTSYEVNLNPFINMHPYQMNRREANNSHQLNQ
jgi:hypothetical protein